MTQTKFTFLLSAALLIANAAPAQSGDWQAVKNLQPGARISVSVDRPFHTMCIFQRATDEELLCERILRGSRRVLIPPDAIYERGKIREVRLEHGDSANVATGAVIGGGVGATIGASTHNTALTRPGRILLLGTGGAIIGGFFGRDFPLTHGKVIYRR
jgi:hypothetical protein